MNTPAFAHEPKTAPASAELPLWIAQRAFAAMIETATRPNAADLRQFRAAQLRSAARRTLSGLSADDHTRLQRWLSLQLATIDAAGADAARGLLARVDAPLGAGVAAALVPVREELSTRTAAVAA